MDKWEISITGNELFKRCNNFGGCHNKKISKFHVMRSGLPMIPVIEISDPETSFYLRTEYTTQKECDAEFERMKNEHLTIEASNTNVLPEGEGTSPFLD